MAEIKNSTHQTTIHAYRGIPEVHDWSHYRTLDIHWTVCGYQRTGRGGIPAIDSKELSDHLATTDLTKVNCPFCLDLIEGTQRRQARIPPRCKALPDGEVVPFDPLLMATNKARTGKRSR